MRALLLIACVLSVAAAVFAAEPVLVDKSQLVGGDFPKQYRPDYPLEARRRHQEGNGVFILHIDVKTGQVTSITVKKSTGHKLLDSAVLTACVHWRFKPHTVTDVRRADRFLDEAPILMHTNRPNQALQPTAQTASFF